MAAILCHGFGQNFGCTCHDISNLPGITPMKPGSCTMAFFGIDAVVLDPAEGTIVEADAVTQD